MKSSLIVLVLLSSNVESEGESVCTTGSYTFGKEK